MRQLATTAWATAVLLLLASSARAEVTVCNEFVATIHVAFAEQVDSGFKAAGWWTVPTNSCQDVDFTLQGSTLYYAADSDSYRSGHDTRRDHWGNKQQLFVGSKKFNVTDADKSRRGTKAVMFSFAAMSPQLAGKDVKITVHFKHGGTSIGFAPK